MRTTRLRPWVLDLLVCGSAAVVTAYRIDAAVREAGDRAPDAIAYGIGLTMAVALAGRRRWPAWTLAGVVLLWLLYHLLDFPGGAPAVPVWVALYSVAVAPRRWPGLAIAGALLVSDALARTAQTGARLFDAMLDGSTMLFLAALLIGDGVRTRRSWRAEHEARAALAAAQLVADERLRIARELHDVSAHTLAVITVQAGVAADLIDDEPQRAGQALALVRAACSEAMGELRAAVGVLRDPAADPEPDPAPPHGLERLEQLAVAHGTVGPRIGISYVGARRPLPRLVEATAFRIVQESVTNVLRHSGATRVDVTVDYRPDGLALEIHDDGRGRGSSGADGSAGGNGLRGMAERAASVGGWLDAGPGDAGFRVRAWLPVAVHT